MHLWIPSTRREPFYIFRLHYFLLLILFNIMSPNASAQDWNEASEQTGYASTSVDFSQDWEYAYTPAAQKSFPTSWNSLQSLGQPQGWDGTSALWLRKRFSAAPSGLYKDPVVLFLHVDKVAEFWVDEKKIYQHGVVGDNHKLRSKQSPIFVPISEVHQQSWLIARVLSDRSVIGVGSQAKLGNIEDTYRETIRTHIWEVAVGGILAMLGLFSLGLYAQSRRQSILLGYGLTMTLLSIYILSSGTISRLLVPSSTIRINTEFISLYVLSTALIFYSDQIFGVFDRWRIQKILLAVHLTNAMVCLGVAISGTLPIYQTLRYWQLLTLVSIPFILFFPAMRSLKGDREALLFGMGLWTFLILGAMAILCAMNLLPSAMKDTFVALGTMGFAVGLGTIVLRRYRLVNEEMVSLTQELALKNQKLTHLDRMKDEFLANTSHELRTPLNGIIGIAESVLAGAMGPLNGKIQENLRLIANSGRRLSNLINDILDMAKLRENKVNIRVHSLASKPQVDIVLTALYTSAAKHLVKLENLVDDSTPPVLADEDRFQQILYNLIGNALKFTETGCITVSAEATETHVCFSIRDTGIGIPQDRQQELFQSFVQLDASTERVRGGTGLGLAITRNLVELHGGRIWFESEEGHGTTFFFTLPQSFVPAESCDPDGFLQVRSNVLLLDELSEGETQEQEVHHHCEDDDKKSRTILVVDDEPVNRQVLRNYLVSLGFIVQEAADGSSALAKINRSSPDLILLDIMMPGMSGFDVCRTLRESEKYRNIPVLFLTARNQSSSLVEGFACGANDYLTKPFLFPELLARIKMHLRQSSLLSEVEEGKRILMLTSQGVKDVLTAPSRIIAFGRMTASIATGIGASPFVTAKVIMIDSENELDTHQFILTQDISGKQQIPIGNGLALSELQTIPKHTIDLNQLRQFSREAGFSANANLVIPLLRNDVVLGFVELFQMGTDHLNEHDRIFLATYSESVGAVLEHLRREQTGRISECAA